MERRSFINCNSTLMIIRDVSTSEPSIYKESSYSCENAPFLEPFKKCANSDRVIKRKINKLLKCDPKAVNAVRSGVRRTINQLWNEAEEGNDWRAYAALMELYRKGRVVYRDDFKSYYCCEKAREICAFDYVAKARSNCITCSKEELKNSLAHFRLALRTYIKINFALADFYEKGGVVVANHKRARIYYRNVVRACLELSGDPTRERRLRAFFK